MKRIRTPWGMSDDGGEKIAEGITFYSTPSHGGVLLSPERRAAMPTMLREIIPPVAARERDEATFITMEMPT